MWTNNLLPFCLIFNVLSINEFINGAPSNYCNKHLNTSDCAMPPVPVFTYYKAGSRCEIELWRGCSTLNKFDSIYECSHFCIGKLSPSFSAEEDNQVISSESMKLDCKMQINLQDCDRLELVYTYNNDKRKCQKIKWRGCETYNKFDDYDSCFAACRGFMGGSSEIDRDGSPDSSQQGENGSGFVGFAAPNDEYGGKQSISTQSGEDEGENKKGGTNDSHGETPDNSEEGEAKSE